MADLIDREALKRDLIDNRSFFPAIVKRALETAPAAEIIFRSCTIDKATGTPTLIVTIGDEALALHLPPIDAVEVVRCKDCLFREPPEQYGDLQCKILNVPMKDDDFCSYGERRDDER